MCEGCGIGLGARRDRGREAGEHVAHRVLRTGMPAAAIAAFAVSMEWVPKWKIEAASTADA